MLETTLELPISGMTCVGCARSIEVALSRKPGIQASVVNFPDSSVAVTFDQSQIRRDEVIQAIRESGFEVVEATDDDSLANAMQLANEADSQRQLNRLWFGLALTLPLFVLSMGRDFGLWGSWANANWVNWLMFALATPVQIYVGWDYYVSAANSLRNRFANMDVLVSLGSTTAYLYSIVVMLSLSWGSTAGAIMCISKPLRRSLP